EEAHVFGKAGIPDRVDAGARGKSRGHEPPEIARAATRVEQRAAGTARLEETRRGAMDPIVRAAEAARRAIANGGVDLRDRHARTRSRRATCEAGSQSA